jgi:hypothetical protein
MLPHLQDAATMMACSLLTHSNGGGDIPFASLGRCFDAAATESSPLRTIIADSAVHRLGANMDEVSIEVERHLACCEGFFRAFCASQAAKTTLDPDQFPRYLKPAKSGTQFFKTKASENRWRDEEDNLVAFSSEWDPTAIVDCGNCGLHYSAFFDGTAVCLSCDQLASCGCGIDGHWVMQCRECYDKNEA